MKIKAKKTEELKEFKSSDDQSETYDPVETGDSSRAADKKDGEKAIPEFKTKVATISAIVQSLAGLPKDSVANVWKGLNATSFNTKRPADKAGNGEEEQIITSPTGVGHLVKKEDVDDMFAGEELTEEFKDRALVLFEAAVNIKASLAEAELEEAFEARLEEAVEDIRVELVENVDKYLSYTVDEWLKANEVAVDSGLKADMAEELIAGLSGLLETYGITIPDTEISVVEELTKENEELKEQVSTLQVKSIDLTEELSTYKFTEKFDELSEDLTDTQREKLRTLMEGVSFEDVDQFTKKAEILKETYFTSKKKTKVSDLSEETLLEDEEVVKIADPKMKSYADAISRSIVK